MGANDPPPQAGNVPQVALNVLWYLAKGALQMALERITVDPAQMGGGMVADGMSEREILEAYPDLEPEDVREALRYAAEAVRERQLPLHRTA
jgi:uncharacterized protein (DUF433 family)